MNALDLDLLHHLHTHDALIERRVLPPPEIGDDGEELRVPMVCTFHHTPEDALNYDQGPGENVYFGVAPRTTTRGRAVDCLAPRAVWVDIDPAEHGLTVEEAPMVTPRPSAVVQSGRGVQLYWFVRDMSVEEWSALSKAWTGEVRSRLKLYPELRVDSTFDIARVMRMPGTVNSKTGRTAVTLELNGAALYDIGDFLISEEAEHSSQAVEEIDEPSTPGTRNPRLWQIASALKWRGGLRDGMLFDAMQAVNNVVCSPPLPKRELAQMVERLNDPSSPQPLTVAESAAITAPSDVAVVCAEHLVGNIMSVRSGGNSVWYTWSQEAGVWREAPPHSAIRDWLVMARDANRVEEAGRVIGQCLSLNGLGQVASLLGNMPAAPTYMDEECLNRDDMVLPVRNGYLDLETGELRKPDPTARFTLRAEVDWDPGARCPRWLDFLNQMVPDQEEQAFLAKCFYYYLTGLNTSRAFFINLGVGRNGKSLAHSVLSDIMGGFAGPGDHRVVTKGQESGHDAPVASLLHKRLAIYDELGSGDELNGPQVKRLTGGDRVKARAAYASKHEDIRMTCKHVLISNHRPRIQGEDMAVGDRLRYIQWRTRLAPTEVDHRLKDSLLEERSGILTWIMDEGRRPYLEGGEGLDMPPRLAAEALDYLEDENEMLGFVRRFIRIPDNANPALSADGAELGRKWHEYTGEKLTGRGWSAFYRDLVQTIELEGGTVEVTGARTKRLRGVVCAEPGQELME